MAPGTKCIGEGAAVRWEDRKAAGGKWQDGAEQECGLRGRGLGRAMGAA